MGVNGYQEKGYRQLVLSSTVQPEQMIPERSIIGRPQPAPAFHAVEASGYWFACVLQRVCALLLFNCFASFSVVCVFIKLLQHIQLFQLSLWSPERKKHLDVEMDWFAALYTGIRNIIGLSESVKYLWECLLTVCYYKRKEKIMLLSHRKVDNFPPKGYVYTDSLF